MKLLLKREKISSVWKTFLHKFSIFARSKRQQSFAAAILDLLLIIIILITGAPTAKNMVDPLISPLMPLHPIAVTKASKEIFGFAPYWNMDKLGDVDFNILTTFAYFGVEVLADGNLDKDSVGFETFKSSQATKLFKKAHSSGTRVVLTLTQMDNSNIRAILDDAEAQNRAIEQAVKLVRTRGIDGLNIDFEYAGDPGNDYRSKFTDFVNKISQKMHAEIHSSQVTVSMYASSVKEPKIYNVAELSHAADKIFMMAYDFATSSSDHAIPTSPLNGHKSGKYWYDVSSAVEDFLKVASSDKIILGVPYYGYNYLVYDPQVKGETRPHYSWRGQPYSQTYTNLKDKFQSLPEDVDQYFTGWDEDGKVGYLAYHVISTDTWRMIFMEDEKSLALKYDFAKDKDLAGVGIWALGNDAGKQELWNLLREKFAGRSVADNTIIQRRVEEIE